MIEGEIERVVRVWSTDCTLHIHQRSKTVWVARGDYMGKPLEVKGKSASAAAKAWQEAARYRGIQ